jgi:hypothetical protein
MKSFAMEFQMLGPLETHTTLLLFTCTKSFLLRRVVILSPMFIYMYIVLDDLG